MVFEKKKVNIETLGEYLKEVRDSLCLTVLDVAKKTGIKEKHINSLEAGKLQALPSEVYVLGFLKSLASLYNIDRLILVEQFKKEQLILQNLQKHKNNAGAFKNKLANKFLLTPKLLSLILGLTFVFLTLAYIVWQVTSINKTPALEILEPKDQAVISDSFVEVKGHTTPGMSVSVNEQDIFVDSDGNFKTQVGVSNGSKEIVVVSKNKLDKSVAKSIRVMVKQPEVKETVTSGFMLKLEFLGDAIISFKLDDNESQTLNFHNGDSKLLTAQNKILVSTSDAGATKVYIDGKAVGLMGRPGEVLKDIPFFAEATGSKSSEAKP